MFDLGYWETLFLMLLGAAAFNFGAYLGRKIMERRFR